jgi:hypothetical protein
VGRDHFCFPTALHPAIAFCLTEPSGKGEARTISSQTSRAAVRVALASPLAALSQTAFSLALVLAFSVGSCSTPRLHEATADPTAGSFGELVVVAGVD